MRGGKESLTSQWIVSCSPGSCFLIPAPDSALLVAMTAGRWEAGLLLGLEPEFASMYARGGGAGMPSCTHQGLLAHWPVLG